MEITINTTSLRKEIEMISSFVGRTSVDNEGKSLYDKIKIKEQDYSLIDKFIESSIEKLISSLSEFFDTKEESSGNMVIYLSVPDSFNDSYEHPIEAHSASFIKNTVMFEWLLINYEEASSGYIAKAQDDIKEVRKLFYKRTQPIKRIWK